MTDANDKPVSMRKRGTAAPKTDVPRPTSVVALAAAMMLSGLASVVAALTLYGQHHYLVTNLAKNEPKQKMPNSVVVSLTDATTGALVDGLTGQVGQKLTSTTTSSIAKSTSDAFKKAADPANFGKNQLSDQVSKVSSEVSKELGALTGTITSTDVSDRRTGFSSALKADLQDLQKSQLDAKQIDSQASKIPTSQLIAGIVLTVALGFVAFGSYAGRYWGRWAVPVIWVLSSFTGTSAGIVSLLQLGADVPVGYKLVAALSSAALVIAVILSFIRPTKIWWEAHRPAPVPGAPARRGLFAPRVPPSQRGASTRPTGGRVKPGSADRASDRNVPARRGSVADGGAAASRTTARTADRTPDRTAGPRAKKRVAAEATRNGADLARSRAKTAAKSRRTES